MRPSQSLLGVLSTTVLLSLGCSDGVTQGTDPLSSAGTPGAAAGSSPVAGSPATSAGGSSSGSGPVATGGGVASTAGANAGAGVGNGPSAGGSSGGSASGVAGSGGANPTGTAGMGGSASAGGSSGGSAGGGAMPTDGKGLYDANCKACHGEQGVGGSLAPEIQHPVRDYSNWVVRNGRSLVAPWPKAMDKYGTDKLTDAQLTLIWNYLDQPPQPTTGKALYADYCANCHGADAKGGVVTRNILNEVAKITMLVRNGKSIGQYSMRHDSMPKFDTMRITDAELKLISDYVDSL